MMIPESKTDEQLIPIERARIEANIVRALFTHEFERWEFAGSLRRELKFVSDIEHIIIPRGGEVHLPGTMFPTEVDNLVNHSLDQMLAKGLFEKATYGDSKRTRWGDKSRSFVWDGIRHEVYTATVDTWGVVMALRTGPWQLSKRMVTQIKRQGYEVRDGNQVFPMGRDRPIPMQTEEVFFAICGIRYCEPKDRFP